ncbi:hypothetical protein TgHK011_000487 [Trichoderma gracile]|nr:hypothetical protein TgHK011_000487 [Trichoderma gracile]
MALPYACMHAKAIASTAEETANIEAGSLSTQTKGTERSIHGRSHTHTKRQPSQPTYNTTASPNPRILRQAPQQMLRASIHSHIHAHACTYMSTVTSLVVWPWPIASPAAQYGTRGARRRQARRSTVPVRGFAHGPRSGTPKGLTYFLAVPMP